MTEQININSSAKAPQQLVTSSPQLGDDVILAALVVGVVACVGVVCLSVAVCCLLSRVRKRRREHDIDMIETDPTPRMEDIIQHLNNNTPKITRQGSASVGVGTLRQVALTLLQDLLLNLYNVNVKRTRLQDKQQPPAAARKESIVPTSGSDEVQRQLRSGLVKIFPDDSAKVNSFLALGQSIMAASSVRPLSEAAFRAMRLCTGVVRQWGVLDSDFVGVVPTEGQGHVSVAVDDEVNCLTLAWEADKWGQDLLTAVSNVCQAARDERRQPTPDEYLATQLAYHLLGQGQQMSGDSAGRPLGSPGFRPHVQTQLALTDSGYGHVLGSTRRSDWLQGVVVHVQHIGSLEGDSDEAPTLFDLAKVRLHVGEAASTTFFVSTGRTGGHTGDRPVTEPQRWERELPRLVQLTANTISAAFYQGAAACHVSMAGLSTSQAAAFMSQLRPHVHRERHLQALSAVWDLGAPLTDDYLCPDEGEEGEENPQGPQETQGPQGTQGTHGPQGTQRPQENGTVAGTGPARPDPTVNKTRIITEPRNIARRAIDITLVGGFDQVTWYSSCSEPPAGGEAASNSGGGGGGGDSSISGKPRGLPSGSSSASEGPTCVLRRLTTAQVLGLVHAAHTRGLLTYFTGGVTCRDIVPAVLGGVDGVGVGGVGSLHRESTGRNSREQHGPFMEENIPQLLQCRDEAAVTWQGRGAHLLARLDTMFYEGSLAVAENALRTQLFNALVDSNAATVESVMAKLDDVMQLPSEFGHPVVGVASRLVARKAPALKEVAESAYEWAMFVARLKMLLGRGDQAGVCEEYGGAPWEHYRRKHRQLRQGPQGYFRQVSFQVHLKTDFSFD